MSEESWHLSKNVPISLIIALVLQTGGFVWLIANMDSRIFHNKEGLAELKTEVSSHTLKQNSVDVKLGRIEEKVEGIDRTLQTISRQLNDY